MIKISIILTFFTISLAYAHPNHMTFENTPHDKQISGVSAETDKLIHNSIEEKSGHSDILPCVEQHKALPCKKN